MDVDGRHLFVLGGPDEPSYTIDVAATTAVEGNPPGGGRWDDFAHHPKDGRLISVEGDNGDLLFIDPRKRQPPRFHRGHHPRQVRAHRPGTTVEASSVTTIYEGGTVYIDSLAGQLLEAGHTRPLSVRTKVAGEPAKLPHAYPLAGLKGTRLAWRSGRRGARPLGAG